MFFFLWLFLVIFFFQIEFLQSELEDRDNEKEALKNQVIVLEDNVTHVNNKLMDIEKERDIEISQKERLTKELKENNDKVNISIGY